jgi:hypothetical protein
MSANDGGGVQVGMGVFVGVSVGVAVCDGVGVSVLVGIVVGVGVGWQALRRRVERRRNTVFLFIVSRFQSCPFSLL